MDQPPIVAPPLEADAGLGRRFGWALLYASIPTVVLLAGAIITASAAGATESSLLTRLLNASGEWPLLLAPGAAGIFFSICYAFSQHTVSPALVAWERLIVWCLLAVALLVGSYGFVVYGDVPGYFSAAALLHFGACVLYGFFLLRERVKQTDQLVRHQLLWPVALAVGVNLYVGLSLHSLLSRPAALGPLAVVLLWMAIGIYRKPSDKRLITSSVALAVAAVVAIVGIRLAWPEYHRDGFWGHFTALIFSLTVAAYLAVLEAWQITADHAKVELKTGLHAAGATIFVTDVTSGHRTSRYYVATLAALCAAIAVFPLVYTFTNSGLVFIYLFSFFALASLAAWIWGIETAEDLDSHNWSIRKIVFALVFLSLVVADVALQLPFGLIFRSDTSASLLTIVAVFVGFLMTRLAVDPKWQNRRAGIFVDLSVLAEVFSERRNALRLLGILSFVAMMGLSLWQNQQDIPTSTAGLSGDALRHRRIDGAIGVYAFIVISMAIADLFQRNRDVISPSTRNFAIIWSVVGMGRGISLLLVGGVLTLGMVQLGAGGSDALVGALPFLLCVAGGGALNDYFDQAKDAIDKPWRAIAIGAASPRAVLVCSLLLLGASPISGGLAGYTNEQMGMLVGAVAGVVLYNVVVRYLGVAKAFVTGGLCAIPVAFLLANSSTPAGPFIAAVFLFVSGRELLMDIVDVAGDRAAGSRTLAIVLGAAPVSVLGFLFQLCALLILSFSLADSQDLTRWLVHAGAALAATSVCIAWFAGLTSRRRLTYWLWAPIGAEMVVLVLSLRP